MSISKVVVLGVALLPLCFSRGVRAQFDPRTPEIGPFPSDFLTVPDSTQRTGRRVNLPLPDCKASPSDCGELTLINQLDGFNPTGRMTVKFSAPVNPDTLRDGLLYVWLDPVLPGRFNLGPSGKVTVINQPVYDPATNTAYAKPDEILESGRRYLILVTDKVRDLNGDPVEAEAGFNLCLAKQLGGDYCAQLSDALTSVRSSLGSANVVNASIYTTLATSAWYEQVLPVIEQTPPNFTRTGSPNSIAMSTVQGLLVHRQTTTTQFSDLPVPLTPPLIAQFNVGTLAFGSFQSPRFIGPTFAIPNTPTLSTPVVVGTEEIFFHVWLPKSAAPARGYPVIIAGHGFGDNSFGLATALATANSAGYAVIGMNAVGHGRGPKSTVRLFRADGSVAEFSANGRGIDLNGDGTIDDGEGCLVVAPGAPFGFRDCFRQTVVDFLQLIHAVRTGIDLDVDGRFDLDPSSINYFGQSLGGGYGAALTAVSPDIKASVLNVAFGPQTDTRLSSQRGIALALLTIRQPSLLNNGADFVDDLPLRYQPVKLRTTPGSAAIQEVFERVDWLEAVTSPVVLAPFIKSATLPGQGIKRVLFQMALGDQTVPNPSTTSIIRAANMTSQVSLYRFDIAKSIDPTLPPDPHTFLIPVGSNSTAAIGFAALQQGFTFLASGSTVVPDVNALLRPVFGKDLFEEPPATLPEK